jgi:hypothetical protein
MRQRLHGRPGAAGDCPSAAHGGPRLALPRLALEPTERQAQTMIDDLLWWTASVSSSVCNPDDGGCVYTGGCGPVSTSGVADRRGKGCTAVGDLERRGGIPAAGRRRTTPPRAGQTQGSGVETQAWAVVLAGGKEVRLSGLTRHVYGEDRPKQYIALTGGKSLLRQTLAAIKLLGRPALR